MGDDDKPRAVYNPGELDKTRRNLGDISPDEIKDLTKLLGGKIGYEKVTPEEEAALAKAKESMSRSRTSGGGGKAGAVAGRKASSAGGKGRGAITAGISVDKNAAATVPPVDNRLPAITNAQRNRLDRLMMQSDYQIKTNFGIFNFFFFMNKNRGDKVTMHFVNRTLNNYITHMSSCSQNIAGLMATVPDTYKQHILRDRELKPRFLRACAAWDFTAINNQYEVLRNVGSRASIQMLVPTIRNLYQMLLPIYFLGPDTCCALVESVATDLAKIEGLDRGALMPYIRKAVAEFKYMFYYAVRGMYPLLMRMCSTTFQDYPAFFTLESSSILKFLRLTKYDLLLPEKKKTNLDGTPNIEDEDIDPTIRTEEEREDAEGENAASSEETAKEDRERDLTAEGLKLLNRLFPDTGWLKLNSNPDFYPFFQPIFKFPDGYNLVAPENPVQKVMVFLRILGDLFRGCRHIAISLKQDATFASRGDSLDEIMEEWDVYQDILFGKNYAEQLKNLVNQLFAQAGYIHSAAGKKAIYTLLWQAKNFYLPHYVILAMGKASYDMNYKPLFLRLLFLKDLFVTLSERIEAAEETHDAVPGVANPWAPYQFDISNAVSKRLDLINKVQQNQIMSTNGGLIKYTASVVCAANWYINSPHSPAYTDPNAPIYRISPEDGSPAYPPPLREDQYQLFKRELSKLAAAASPPEGTAPASPPGTEPPSPDADARP